MSFLAKALQGFAGLGAVATIPLTLVFTHKPVVVKARAIPAVMPPPPVPKKETQPEKVEIIDQILQIIAKDQPSSPTDTKQELDRRGYFALKDSPRHQLFVFIDLNTLNTPIFFHYDWAERNFSKRIKRIEKMVFKSAKSADLTLQDSPPKRLQLPPIWMKEWIKQDFYPENNCSFSKEGEGEKELYKLTCSKLDNKPLEQTVSINDITLAKTTSNKSR